MKQVLISIQPKWVELIASGKKTIEVRKTAPKLETPFKCYIYETQAKYKTRLLGLNCICQGRGKVIGYFVCNRIDSLQDHEIHITNLSKLSCVSIDELYKYSKGGKDNLYGWHISDLKIYDKPKGLNEFKKENKCYKKGDLDNIGCWERGCIMQEQGWCDGRYSKITRPPQSWGYINV